MIRFACAACLLILALSACGDSEDEFSGIVVTVIGSQDPLSEDPEDWQPRCGQTIPTRYCAVPARPNPATSSVNFTFGMPETGEVSIHIEDAPGSRVRTLASGKIVAAGSVHADWDLTDENGERLPPGIYRVFFHAQGNSGGEPWTSFGDVQVEPPPGSAR